LVNFASLRSAYDVTLEAIKIDQLRTIAIIAEGIPENMTRTLNKKAKDKGVIIIGPATVGKETQIKLRLFLVIAMCCQASSSQFNHSIHTT
jgi:succinyl-CoA synthetase alpha subunit